MKAKDFSEFCDLVIKYIDKRNDDFSYVDRRYDGYFHISSKSIIDSSSLSVIFSIMPRYVIWYVGTTIDNEPKISFYL